MTEVERIISRADRGRVLFVGTIVGICLILAGAIAFAIAVNFKQDSRITKVESVCVQDPDSSDCQRVKRESDEARSLADTCIAFWKAGYACPKPGSKAARREVVASSGNSPSGQSSPGDEPGGKAGRPRGDGGDVESQRPRGHEPPPDGGASEPAPAPTPPASTSSPAPAPQPGNSGSGASEEHGLDVCVDVVVSACAKADTPRLLP